MMIYYIIDSYWSSDDTTLACDKREKTETIEEDPFLSMARDGHKLKMKVLKLKE